MSKRGIAAGMLCLCAFLCSCNSTGSGEENKTEYPVITFVYPGNVRRQENAETAEAAINEILRERIGAEIRLKGITGSDYAAEFRETVAMNEPFDIAIATGNSYSENMMIGSFLDISELIEEYGKGILETVGRDVVGAMKQDTHLYGIPNIRDYAVTTDTYVLNLEILERNLIDFDSIQTMEDLESAMEQIHAAEPDTMIMASESDSFIGNTYYAASSFEYPIGVLEDQGQGDRYINYFRTQEYKELLERVRRWYENGWIKARIEGSEVVKESGEELVDVRYGKPDVNQEVSRYNGGSPYRALSFGRDVITHGTYQLCVLTVSAGAKDPQLCMKILNEFYTDAEINRQLKTLLFSWNVPNLFLTDPADTSPRNLWELYERFNADAVKAKDLAFNFDYTPVIKEYIEVAKIYDRYRPLLENGLVEVESTLAAMNEEMDQAGIEDIVEEKNRQYEIWKNRN
ncbi:MAG: ABC transporter substrate-binding protein [Solobacterium sp.]|nr:ABC transporter substrate-binding protein [Solobacterium sp.]